MVNRYGNPVTDDLAHYHATKGRTHLWWGKVALTKMQFYGDEWFTRAAQHFDRASEHFYAVGMWFTNHGTAMAARMPGVDVACPRGADGIDHEHEPGWTDFDAQAEVDHVRAIVARISLPDVSGSVSLNEIVTGIRTITSKSNDLSGPVPPDAVRDWPG